MSPCQAPGPGSRGRCRGTFPQWYWPLAHLTPHWGREKLAFPVVVLTTASRHSEEEDDEEIQTRRARPGARCCRRCDLDRPSGGRRSRPKAPLEGGSGRVLHRMGHLRPQLLRQERRDERFGGQADGDQLRLREGRARKR